MKLKLLTLTIIFCAFAWQFDVNAQDLKFDNLVLVSGVDKQVGAVYRQTLAAPGIDATITIVDLTGGTTLHTFDDNGSGMIDAFQPTVTKSTTLIEEYARFQFDFFVTGTSTPTNVVNAEVNAVDVDGCCGLYEYSVYHGADSYTVETPTALTAYEVPEGIRFQGPYGGPTSIDYSRTDYIAKVKYNATDSFTIDIGSNGNSVWPDRQASVYFKEITFASPVTTFTSSGQLDFDGIDDYVEMISSAIDGLNEFTISFWFKYNGPIPSGSDEVFVLGQKGFFEIFIRQWGSGSNPDLLSINAGFVQGTGLRQASGRAFKRSDWINFSVTMTRDPGTLVTNYNVYSDGYKSGDRTTTNTVNTSPNPFRFGIINGATSTWNFTGWMDEIKIFNKALTEDQLQRMVYQEIKNESGNIRGLVIDKDIVDISTNTTIPWTDLITYYPMAKVHGNILKDESTSIEDAIMYNMSTLQQQTAPLPFETVVDGDWTDEATWLHGDIWNIEDMVDYFGSSNQSPEPWTIVKVHNDVTTSLSHRSMGLFIDENRTLTVNGNNSISNNWYLQLDGTLDLADDSQLVQTINSDLVTSAAGKILRRQEGNNDVHWYNYWTSPVGATGVTTLSDNNGPTNNTNNSAFNLDMLKDGLGSDIQFTSAFDDAGKISRNWLYNFLNGITYYDWVSIDETTPVAPGVGYTHKGTGNAGTEQQYLFEGKPNNGTILLAADDVTDIYEAANGGESVQDTTLVTSLVGNPYPSALDAEEFIRDNIDFDNGGANPTIKGTILLWEQWAGDTHWLSEYEGGYGFINLTSTERAYQHPDIVISDPENPDNRGIKTPTKFLPVGQGFFVEVVTDLGDIEFNNSQRTFKRESIGESVFLRDATETTVEEENTLNETQILRLEFGVSSGASRSFVLGFSEQTTDGFDYGYDGGLITNPPADDMGSLLDGQQYVIQAFAPITPDKEVDLVLHASGNFTYSLRATEISNIPEGQDLFIRDNLTGASYDLRSAQQYDFTSVAGSFTERFQVIFEDPTLSTPDEQRNNVIVFMDNDKDLLFVKGLQETAKNITITNMIGQISRQFSSVSINTLKNGIDIGELSSGIYIVNIATESNGQISKKIIKK